MPTLMTTAALPFADRLNREYLERHVAKEDAFWTAYMGLGDDAVLARTALNEREIALQRWLQDPEQLDAVRRSMQSAQGDDAVILRGWEHTFVAHCIDIPEARSLAEAIVTLEGDLANARSGMKLGYIEPDGSFVAASSVKLGAMLRTDPEESKRRAAWNALRSIEDHVLANGFVDVVRERNRLGRMLGGEDYYDWKVRRVERMTKREIFTALGELEMLTRDAGRRGLAFLRERHGEAIASRTPTFCSAIRSPAGARVSPR
jgi:hypothetical protein